MHDITVAALLAAVRLELQSDPSRIGYAGKSAAEIAALMDAPVAVQPAMTHRHVPKTDVTGYLHARMALVPLQEWAADAPPSRVRTIAKSLIGVLASDVKEFLTGFDASRARVLGMFQELAASNDTPITEEHYAAIEAMTLAPAGAPIVGPPRWAVLIDGISGEEGFPGPPNAADVKLIEEAFRG